ncbi:MAG: hypothetical protein DYG89_23600 [Caldilinea sp. CFX5]|nr:hypothetical protein [Caldilinea sp. CFX5]
MSKYPVVERKQIVAAIRIVQTELHWKPGSAERHLAKRILRGHLPITARMEDYEQIIRLVVHSSRAYVYLFWYDGTPYVTVADDIHENHWLVMFDLDGLLESAYLVERPDRYFQKENVEFIDRLEAVLP